MNPITVEMLREDWADDPDLSEHEAGLLLNLSDQTVQDALDTAFRHYEDMWFTVLDSTRADATTALLGARRESGLG